MDSAWKMTTPFHRSPYPAILPLRPELTQAGKTVLITGGNAGIGFAIAKAFVQASTRRIILLGRRAEQTQQAALQLSSNDPSVEVVGRTCDVSSTAAVEELWGSLAQAGVNVDVLVLNAVKISEGKPLLEAGTESIWRDFDMNVRAQLQMVERFYKQPEKDAPGPKYLVNLSTFAIHDWKFAAAQPGYGLTKSAAAVAMQLISQDVPPEKMQIINMNPGGVFTQNARDAGYSKDSYQWNDPDLPGQFAVWLASPEAAFLHGRFVWTEWDIDQLKSEAFRKKIDEDPYYLKVGVRGL